MREIKQENQLPGMQGAIVYLAFETGRAYERLYTSLGLYDIVNFNDVAHANSCGHQRIIKGDMSNLGELWKCHITNKEEPKVGELNKLADNLRFLMTIPLE